MASMPRQPRTPKQLEALKLPKRPRGVDAPDVSREYIKTISDRLMRDCRRKMAASVEALLAQRDALMAERNQ
jgi:hypothetical protein